MWDIVAFLIQQLLLWVGLPFALVLLDRSGKNGKKRH